MWFCDGSPQKERALSHLPPTAIPGHHRDLFRPPGLQTRRLGKFLRSSNIFAPAPTRAGKPISAGRVAFHPCGSGFQNQDPPEECQEYVWMELPKTAHARGIKNGGQMEKQGSTRAEERPTRRAGPGPGFLGLLRPRGGKRRKNKN